MKLRVVKRIAVSVTASAAMVGGLALAAPTAASAATASPTMEVSQDGNDVTVKLTRPGLAPCGAAAIELGRAVEVLADPSRILEGGQGITVITGTGPFVVNPNTGTKTLPDGVYVIAAACTDVISFSDPVVQPIIVPTGIGSLSSALNFGSTVLENPEAIGNLLALSGVLS